MRTLPAIIVSWRKRPYDPDADLKPLAWRSTALLVIAVILGGAALALWLTDKWTEQHIAGLKPSDAPLAAIRLDAIKTALTVAAALGAGITLLMALRRQSISERAQRTAERAQRHAELAAERSHRLAEQDAGERRITELYVAAVQQLGSDKAPVRLGGLYALERIGNDHPKMRQTIIDVWCAYLRMPYTPPNEVLRHNAEKSPAYLKEDVEDPEPNEQPERRQELQVRLTVQHLISTHLSDPDSSQPDSYWSGHQQARMNLDLSGATLIDFSLQSCEPGRVIGNRAQFHGDTSVAEAHFRSGVSLGGAEFHGIFSLGGAQFYGDAYLAGAQFYGIANLSLAQFHHHAHLAGAQFHGNAYLGEAQFYGDTNLSTAQFHRAASLIEAQFHADTSLIEAQFHGAANLIEVQFHGDTYLNGVQFHSDANLTGAQFHATPTVEGTKARIPSQLPQSWTTAEEPGLDGLFTVLTAAPTRPTHEMSQMPEVLG